MKSDTLAVAVAGKNARKGARVDSLCLLARSRELDDAARTAGDLSLQATAIAGTMQRIWSARLAGCALQSSEQCALQVVDADGRSRADWMEAVRAELANGASELAPGDWIVRQGHAPLPSRILLAIVRIAHQEFRHGYLLVALPRTSSESRKEAMKQVLVAQAERLALLRQIQSSTPPTTQNLCNLAPQHSAESEWLEDFVDLGYIIAHEFNNLLNNLLLQVSIVEMTRGGSSGSPELAAMRQIGTTAAGKVHQFQKLTRQHRPPAQSVNVNEVLRALTGAQSGSSEGCFEAIPVHLELMDQLPPARIPPGDLARLIRLLLRDAAAAMGDPGSPPVIRTTRSPDHIRLAVEDTGPSVAPEQMPQLLEPFVPIRPGSDGLRLAVCRAIARRLQAPIHAANRAPHGLAIVIDLPQDPDQGSRQGGR